jgi:hypothetical protein
MMAVHAVPGGTSQEIGHYLHVALGVPPQIAYETPHKRLPELEEINLVFRSGYEVDKATGRQSAKWYAFQ